MRVLITGAEGFTGQYMAAELARAGHEVHGIARKLSQKGAMIQGFSSVDEGNLNDPASLAAVIAKRAPEWVVHLAAVSYVPHGNIDDLYRTNTVGTRNLLQALLDVKAPVQSVLLASTANVYGNAGVTPLEESVPPQPANDYAISKLAMEYVARIYLQRLPIIVVRPFNYTGVGQSSNFIVPKIVDHFRRRAEFVELGNLDVARDFLDVRTIVDYYHRLLKTPGSVGSTFNVSSGEAWSLRRLLELARSLTGQEMGVAVNPGFLRVDDVNTLCGNSAKLQALVGTPARIELRDTIKWMLDVGENDSVGR